MVFKVKTFGTLEFANSIRCHRYSVTDEMLAKIQGSMKGKTPFDRMNAMQAQLNRQNELLTLLTEFFFVTLAKNNEMVFDAFSAQIIKDVKSCSERGEVREIDVEDTESLMARCKKHLESKEIAETHETPGVM